jgi:hypothetical protein
MEGPVLIELGGLRFNVMSLQSVTLDCSKLFAEESEAGVATYTLLHNKSNNILNLRPLDPLRTTDIDDFEFLPTKIYVRSCMQEIFNKIVQANNPQKYTIVFGSPGVGKSVLSFLAALCCACFIKRQVLFLRKTSKDNEKISVFWITPQQNGTINVLFERSILPSNGLQVVHGKMVEHIFADDMAAGNITKVRNHRSYLRSMCDGPSHGSKDRVGGADLVTSGGYSNPKDEGWDDINSLPLSAWTLKEMIQGCRHLFKLKVNMTKMIFDLCGGNIRAATAIVVGGDQNRMLVQWREYLDRVVNREGNLAVLKLAVESTKMSCDEDSVDRLRAMFAIPSQAGYTTVQFIGSPYLMRAIRYELPLDETLKGLRYAKISGIGSLYGWHFELFGHKIFQASCNRQVEAANPNAALVAPACERFTIIEGSGTGMESVKQLNRTNVYWTPSTSNFANIDAAIALRQTLYCIQYTVSVSHTFSYHTFVSDFWEQLPSVFRDTISEIIIVFVVPQDVQFRSVIIPKSQQHLSSDATCEDGIVLVFRRKARSAANGKDDDENDNDGDDEMEEDAGEGVTSADVGQVQEHEDEDGDDEDMYEIESDDDCGEEGFDEEEPRSSQLPPAVHFQWEQRDEDFDVEKAPLLFLNRQE